jgi:hypothetical protein
VAGRAVLLLELPHAVSVIVAAMVMVIAAMRVLVFMSGCLSSDGRTGADRVDNVADRLCGLRGGRLLLGEHGVIGLGRMQLLPVDSAASSDSTEAAGMSR